MYYPGEKTLLCFCFSPRYETPAQKPGLQELAAFLLFMDAAHSPANDFKEPRESYLRSSSSLFPLQLSSLFKFWNE